MNLIKKASKACLIISALIPCFFFACSSQSAPEKTVIVSVSPYQTFVNAIAPDLNVICAVPSDANPHFYEPTPELLSHMKNACIWFSIGEPFEKQALTRAKSHSNHLTVISLDRNIPVLFQEGSHSHHKDGVDRHFWMSPKLVSIQCDMIAHALVEKFPSKRQEYLKNLQNYQERLRALDSSISEQLNKAKECAIFVSHPSLGYYCNDFGLTQVSLETEGKAPLPKDIEKVISLSNHTQILCCFIQKQFSEKGARLVAQELNLPVYSLDPHNPEYQKNLETITLAIKKSYEQTH